MLEYTGFALIPYQDRAYILRGKCYSSPTDKNSINCSWLNVGDLYVNHDGQLLHLERGAGGGDFLNSCKNCKLVRSGTMTCDCRKDNGETVKAVRDLGRQKCTNFFWETPSNSRMSTAQDTTILYNYDGAPGSTLASLYTIGFNCSVSYDDGLRHPNI